MSERRQHEWVTKEGRGWIKTRPANDAYRDGWERTFGKGKKPKDEAKSMPESKGAECG